MVHSVKPPISTHADDRLAVTRVFRGLCAAGPLSRGDLRRLVSLSPSTVSDAVTLLLERNFIREAGTADSTGGRPAGLLEVSPGLGGVLAADVGGLRMRVAAADLRGQPLARRALPTPERPRALRDALLSGLSEVRQQLTGPAHVLCLSIAGVVHPHTGEISATDNIAGWRETNIPAWLRDFADTVLVANEANMAAFGEYHHGAAQGTSIAMFLALGAGIGAGLIVAGQLFGGATGAAGEIGLSRLNPDPGSLDLESEVAGPALLAAYQKLTGHRLDNPVDVFHLAERDDQAAAAVVTKALDRLAVTLTNALLVIDPERVIVGGGLATAGELLLQPLRQRIEALLKTNAPEFVLSELGPDAALVGAATHGAQVAVERLASELDAAPAALAYRQG